MSTRPSLGLLSILVVLVVSCGHDAERLDPSASAPADRGGRVAAASSGDEFPAHDLGLYAPNGREVAIHADPPDARITTNPPALPPTAHDLRRNPQLDGKIFGRAPLDVTFNMCRSTDDDGDTLRFTYDFDGDGSVDARGTCRATSTYEACQSIETPAEVCVSDRNAASEHTICQQYQVCARGASQPCVALPGGTFAGTLDPADATMATRLFRDGVASACAGKAYPGTTGSTNVYDTYDFRNEGTDPACVRVSFDVGTCSTGAHALAYTAFDPTDLSSGYLGDVGSSVTQPFEFTVPPLTDFQVVVQSNNGVPGAACSYSFTVLNTGCP